MGTRALLAILLLVAAVLIGALFVLHSRHTDISVRAEARCEEEFVQEYEYVDDTWHKDPVSRDRFCPTPGNVRSNPDEYRRRELTIRLDYSHGDYYIVQREKAWHWDFTHVDSVIGHCVLPEPWERVIAIRFVDGQRESVVVDDGKQTPSIHMGINQERYVLHGPQQLQTPNWYGQPAGKSEDTRFGVGCRITQRYLDPEGNWWGDACMPVTAVKGCAAYSMMLPIRQSGSSPDEETGEDPISGKTTKLQVGAAGTLVDKATWTLQPDEVWATHR